MKHNHGHDKTRDKDGNPVIVRYTANERSNHWVTAICFILAGLSGLAMFHPVMAWLALLFGGGQWTRFLHPFFGLVMFFSFALLVVRFWGHNKFEKGDAQWLRQIKDVVAGDEHKLPKVGRYNAGQKLLFYTLVVCMLALFFTGFVIWREWFSEFFPIPLIRLSALIHAFAAFVLILMIVVHIYAGIWIKGTMGAMIRGTVSYGWVRKHHPRWFEQVMRGKDHH
ncbi:MULTISPECIES: formate dehydrogenase subunit gamma [Massilia]|uniref:Formate dehydrogenase subunit gamma n=1 Tax=Massilia haematophila TaxID=457923 RepID=A0ABV7PJD6_9BURK|nr:formate dehydrogenase subunit gamma [Massilia sp.]